MNKKLTSALLAASLFAAAEANAFYIGVSAGAAKSKIDGDKLDGKASYTASAGFALPLPLVPIRAEVEYLSLKSHEDAVGDVKHGGFAANGYVGLPLLPIIKPYVGLGLADLKQKGNGSKSDDRIAPQYMVGLDLDLPLVPVAGGIEYRYIDAKFKYDGGYEVKTKIQSILAKARVYF